MSHVWLSISLMKNMQVARCGKIPFANNAHSNIFSTTMGSARKLMIYVPNGIKQVVNAFCVTGDTFLKITNVSLTPLDLPPSIRFANNGKIGSAYHVRNGHTLIRMGSANR